MFSSDAMFETFFCVFPLGKTDDNFTFDENSRKSFKWIENTVGKEEIARLRAISPFPTVFSKGLYYRHVKNKTYLVKGYLK